MYGGTVISSRAKTPSSLQSLSQGMLWRLAKPWRHWSLTRDGLETTQVAELLLRDGPNILQEPKIPLIWEIYVN